MIKVEWLLDTADPEKIGEALRYYPVSGVTTNPTILKRAAPDDYFAHLKALKALCGARSLHVQLGSEDAEGMVREADVLREKLGKDIFLKVPVTREGIRAIGLLKAKGALVTATAIYDPLQGILAMAAGADWLAPYCNRMEQCGIRFQDAVKRMRGLIDRDGYGTRIVAASFKNIGQVRDAAAAGAHAATLPPELFDSVFELPLIGDSVAGFTRDWKEIAGDAFAALL